MSLPISPHLQGHWEGGTGSYHSLSLARSRISGEYHCSHVKPGAWLATVIRNLIIRCRLILKCNFLQDIPPVPLLFLPCHICHCPHLHSFPEKKKARTKWHTEFFLGTRKCFHVLKENRVPISVFSPFHGSSPNSALDPPVQHRLAAWRVVMGRGSTTRCMQRSTCA